MKFEYDKTVDAAYIYVDEPIKKGEAKKTIELNEKISVDFDENGKILGFEILEASKFLKQEVLTEAIAA